MFILQPEIKSANYLALFLINYGLYFWLILICLDMQGKS